MSLFCLLIATSFFSSRANGRRRCIPAEVPGPDFLRLVPELPVFGFRPRAGYHLPNQHDTYGK